MFCGPNCRAKYYRQRDAEQRSRECTCENCGKVFTTTRSSVKYCCEECRYEAQIKRQTAKKAAKRAAARITVESPPPDTIENVIAAQDAAEEKIA